MGESIITPYIEKISIGLNPEWDNIKVRRYKILLQIKFLYKLTVKPLISPYLKNEAAVTKAASFSKWIKINSEKCHTYFYILQANNFYVMVL